MTVGTGTPLVLTATDSTSANRARTGTAAGWALPRDLARRGSRSRPRRSVDCGHRGNAHADPDADSHADADSDADADADSHADADSDPHADARPRRRLPRRPLRRRTRPPLPVRTRAPRRRACPTGTKLTVHEGDLTVSTPGAVIDGLEIRGLLIINAPDVVIKNSRILGRAVTGSTGLVSNVRSGLPFTIQDSEITAAVPSPYLNGIFGSAFTAIRVDISNVIDPIHVIGGDVEIRDSWLHDNDHYEQDPLWNGTPSHSDSLQIEAGNDISVIGNRMEGARQRRHPDHAEHVSKTPLGERPHQRQLLQRRRLHGEHRAHAGGDRRLLRDGQRVRPRPHVRRMRHPRARHERAPAVGQHLGGHGQDRRADRPQVAARAATAAPRDRQLRPGLRSSGRNGVPTVGSPCASNRVAGADVDVSSATAPPER